MRKLALNALIPLSALLLTACHAKPAKNQSLTPAPPTAAADANASLVADPCANQMQDLCGAMLMYLAFNHHLPATLEELQPLADAGTKLHLTCPVSGERYVYAPDALTASNIDQRLVLYDATPAHHDKRWGIVVKPVTDNQPVKMWVIPIDDKLMNAYLHGQPGVPAATQP